MLKAGIQQRLGPEHVVRDSFARVLLHKGDMLVCGGMEYHLRLESPEHLHKPVPAPYIRDLGVDAGIRKSEAQLLVQFVDWGLIFIHNWTPRGVEKYGWPGQCAARRSQG